MPFLVREADVTFADEQPIYRNTHPLIEGNSAEDFQNGTEEKYAKKAMKEIMFNTPFKANSQLKM
ncbi:MAG: hypothetical protein IPJ49_19470 [Candidatus Obscuribacter sp.]|nr:hypothetical protein [Candidatus Obscuribacter sp.]